MPADEVGRAVDAQPALRRARRRRSSTSSRAILSDFRPAGFRLGFARPPRRTRGTCSGGSRPRPCCSGASTTPARRSPSRERMRDAIPGAELVVIPGCGHVSNLEQPDRFNAAVREFCRRVPAPKLRPVLPNILLVVLDTARADAFEPYGAPAGATPAIADLARRGRALGRRPCPRVLDPALARVDVHRAVAARDRDPRSAGGLAARRPRGARRATATGSSPTCSAPTATRPGPLSTNLWVTVESGFGLGFDEFRYIGTGRQAHLDRTGLARPGPLGARGAAREGRRRRHGRGRRAAPVARRARAASRSSGS